MSFDSLAFIFLFMPSVLLGCYLFGSLGWHILARWFLVGTSILFYSWGGFAFLWVVLLTVAVNYWIIWRINYYAGRIGKKRAPSRTSTIYLLGAVAWNIVFLLFWKLYTSYFCLSADVVSGHDLSGIGMPLGLSFITFQQLACVVDTYRRKAPASDSLLDYFFFLFFFPQLIAGPIVRWSELMPQLTSCVWSRALYENFSAGLFVFSMGLFKKTVVAGLFSQWASIGFDTTPSPTFLAAWLSSLSYTLQLYYDFSGYSDMAIGVALMLNIRLPINFHSPYQARNIQEFWRRWHMTLSRWLRDYIYIPLGGSRKGMRRLYLNIMVTFLLAGVWHGTGWTYVLWGGLHGVMLVVCRFWTRSGFTLPLALSWGITFLALNISWVLFRAESVGKALGMFKGMLGLNGIGTGIADTIALGVVNALPVVGNGLISNEILIMFAFVFIIAVGWSLFFTPNSMELIGFVAGSADSFQASPIRAVWAGIAASASIICLLAGDNGTSFIYFGF